MTFTYRSGEDIRAGDRIVYAGSPGEVEFVVNGATGDPAVDWHLTHSPNGGVMLRTAAMGLVFLEEVHEDLDFMSRTTSEP